MFTWNRVINCQSTGIMGSTGGRGGTVGIGSTGGRGGTGVHLFNAILTSDVWLLCPRLTLDFVAVAVAVSSDKL